MGLLRLDRQRLEINMILGVLEEYKPTAQVKRLQKRLEGLRKKYSDAMEVFRKVTQDEISPELNSIEEEVNEINNTAYPELAQLQQGDVVEPLKIKKDKPKSKKKATKKAKK